MALSTTNISSYLNILWNVNNDNIYILVNSSSCVLITKIYIGG